MIEKWIAEATECDFKVALEVRKPKSWLKSVSAFANGIGGTLIFGIDNDRNVIGLADSCTHRFRRTQYTILLQSRRCNRSIYPYRQRKCNRSQLYFKPTCSKGYEPSL